MTTKLTPDEKAMLDLALTDFWYTHIKENYDDSPIALRYESLMKKLKGIL